MDAPGRTLNPIRCGCAIVATDGREPTRFTEHAARHRAAEFLASRDVLKDSRVVC